MDPGHPPAAAALMALLRASLGQAAMDDWLAWLSRR